jgi:hypothetical protein
MAKPLRKRATLTLRVTMILLPVTGGACIAGFDTPRADATIERLCDAENALQWEGRVEECMERRAQDQVCGGVIAFSGRLDGEAVTVVSDAQDPVFAFETANNGVVQLDDVAFEGGGPYFDFTLEFGNVGGIFAQDRVLGIDAASEASGDVLDDELASLGLRVVVPGSSVTIPALTDSGELRFDFQGIMELRGSFAAAFGTASDELAGCFQVFGDTTVWEGG